MTGGSKSGGPKSAGATSARPKGGGKKTPRSKPSKSRTAESKTGVEKNPVEKTAVENTVVDNTRGPATGSHDGGGSRSGHPKTNGHAKSHAAAGGPPIPRKANRRGAARLAAVQALYQMDMTGAGLNEILAQFESHWLGREVEGEQYLPAEAAFFRDIVSGVVDVQRDLDPRIDAALEATWPLKRIEAILRSVLRAGAYELSRRTDVPARVVVSEYVDVAHAFVDKTETGMVNAVLDRLARNVRPAEFL
jgi:N utilization substance protein B